MIVQFVTLAIDHPDIYQVPAAQVAGHPVASAYYRTSALTPSGIAGHYSDRQIGY
jgi:hypothetical protein